MTEPETPETCHECGAEEAWPCEVCGRLVCIEHAAEYNQFTQIDYTLCLDCQAGREAADYQANRREDRRREKKEKTRQARNAAARKRYRSPEQVEKRRQQKAEKKLQEAERAREALRIVAEIFNPMLKR